jgi:hydroxymethylbilane synthase
LRGNVDTRLRKLNEGIYDAIVMAKAGLKRLGFEKHIKQDLPLDKFPHAVGQGAIAIASREDFAYKGLLKMIEDEKTRREIEAERSLLKAIGGGCQVPLGVAAEVKNNRIILSASIFSQDGKVRIDAKVEETSAIKAGEKAAKILLEEGGKKIIEEINSGAW